MKMGEYTVLDLTSKPEYFQIMRNGDMIRVKPVSYIVHNGYIIAMVDRPACLRHGVVISVRLDDKVYDELDLSDVDPLGDLEYSDPYIPNDDGYTDDAYVDSNADACITISRIQGLYLAIMNYWCQ